MAETGELKTNQKSKNSIHYFDSFDETRLWLTEKAEKTPEGYLKAQAIVTNTGVFNYLTKDKKISRQLRAPEEVFKTESMESLKNIPIVDLHPKETIDSSNIQALQKKGVIVGFTGSNIRRDGHALSVDVTITNQKMIDKIESGEQRAFSCGYHANTDFTQEGSAFGNNKYNAEQKDIFYNHVAMVPQGRAGDLAKIRMDSSELFNIFDSDIAIQYMGNDIDIENNNKEDNYMSNEKNVTVPTNNITTTLMLDGVAAVIELDRDVAKHIGTLNDSITLLTKNVTELQAKNDVSINENEKLKKELLEKKEAVVDENEINDRVNERIKLINIADFIGLKTDNSNTNAEMKLSIIKMKNDKVDFSDKDDVYINAYFDSVETIILDEMETRKPNENKKVVFGKKNDVHNFSSDVTKEDIYQLYKKKIQNDSIEKQNGARIVDGKLVINN